jgi:hypothetical protein
MAALQREWGNSVQPLKKLTMVAYPYGTIIFISALGIHFRIANSCRRWHFNFKGLSQDGGQTIFLKTSPPHSLMTTY